MASTYLTRTLVNSNQKKFTISVWLKRSKLGAQQSILGVGGGAAYATHLYFDGSDRIDFWNYFNSAYQGRKTTNRKFRDTNAWYHIVAAVDTTSAQSTADDRMKIYVNGVRETSFSTSSNPNEDQTFEFSSASVHQIGRNSGGDEFDGCMSHFHFVDGSQLEPTVFGETDATTGEWKIKTSPSYTAGTNGFWVLKDGNSVTDSSTNSNDFTVAAGTLTKTQDNPSNVFATVNPLWRNRYSNNGTFSNGNTTFSCNDTQNSDKDIGFASMGVTTGKWYWEVRVPAADRAQLGVGDAQQMSAFSSIFYDNNPSYGISLNPSNGNVNYNNTNTAYGSALSNDDIVMVALDMTNHRLWFGKNGSWFNSATTSEISAGTATNDVTTAISSQAILNTGEPMFPFFADTSESGRGKWNVNFGNGYFGTDAVTTNSGSGYQDADGNGIFNYALPTNYRALCTKGLNQ